MEDLAGLNFSSPTSSSQQPKSAPPNQSRFPQNTTTFAAPVPSRGISPNYHLANLRSNIANGNAKPPATSSKGDSFAALSAFSGISRANPSSNASLEQQRMAREKERREAIEKEKRDMQMHFGADEFWEKHSRQNTPTITTTDMSSDVDLSAFSSDAPVNTASHFPPPKDESVISVDPFDMSAFDDSLTASRTRYHTSPGHLESTNPTDDILGVLSQPIETFTKPTPSPPKPSTPQPTAITTHPDTSSDEEDTDRDKAIAAIVEMGFTIGQATKALSTTPSGTDIQAALNDLLSRPSSSASGRLDRPSSTGRRRTPDPSRLTPDSSLRTRGEAGQHAQKDLSQIAGEMGTSLLKGAGSLWKSGREKMNTLIQEYQGETQSDPSVPKWMREQQRYTSRSRREENVTNEAKVLETGNERPRSQQRNQDTRPVSRNQMDSRPATRDRVAMKKQVEEEADMGYRSSARRRVPPRSATPSSEPPSRTATPPITSPPIEAKVDLFSSTTDDIPKSTPSRTSTPQTQASSFKPINKPVQSITRTVPSTSPAALSSSHAARQKGSEAFKLGDYTLALTHYTTALSPLPATHPQRLPLLSNRALTNLKLGDAKSAITDCDDLLREIGPEKGEGETFQDVDGAKKVRELWEKGVLRRAQGLEMLEKWGDAAEMWRVAVDAGVGGSVALDGRRRCEKALGGKSNGGKMESGGGGGGGSSGAGVRNGVTRVTTVAKGVTKPVAKPTTVARAKDTSASESLAKYHADIAAEDKEKADLYDIVDNKVSAWYNGKESNLRALLTSLDLILWPEAGWKKVNMAELVHSSKVKIVYMRAVAKVHPDKISRDATTEQKMVAAAVVAKLNEAWALFQEQNGR